MEKESDPKKIAQVILEATGLDVESYRLGHTKACLYTPEVVSYLRRAVQNPQTPGSRGLNVLCRIQHLMRLVS